MGRLTEPIVRARLRERNGNQSAVAEDIGVSRSHLCEFIAARPVLQKVVQDSMDELVDMSTDVVRQAIREGDRDMAKFVLKTQGKKRGWQERMELTGADGEAIPITVIKIPTRIPCITSEPSSNGDGNGNGTH